MDRNRLLRTAAVVIDRAVVVLGAGAIMGILTGAGMLPTAILAAVGATVGELSRRTDWRSGKDERAARHAVREELRKQLNGKRLNEHEMEVLTTIILSYFRPAETTQQRAQRHTK